MKIGVGLEICELCKRRFYRIWVIREGKMERIKVKIVFLFIFVNGVKGFVIKIGVIIFYLWFVI